MRLPERLWTRPAAQEKQTRKRVSDEYRDEPSAHAGIDACLCVHARTTLRSSLFRRCATRELNRCTAREIRRTVEATQGREQDTPESIAVHGGQRAAREAPIR